MFMYRCNEQWEVLPNYADIFPMGEKKRAHYECHKCGKVHELLYVDMGPFNEPGRRFDEANENKGNAMKKQKPEASLDYAAYIIGRSIAATLIIPFVAMLEPGAKQAAIDWFYSHSRKNEEATP